MQPKKVEKFVNPTNMPKPKVLRISRSDPRNNQAYIDSSEYTIVVVDDENIIDDEPSIEVALEQSYDVENFVQENGIASPEVFEYQKVEDAPILDIPKNLYLDQTSFNIDDSTAAADGSVKWKASIYFDDVTGATAYEYDMIGVES